MAIIDYHQVGFQHGKPYYEPLGYQAKTTQQYASKQHGQFSAGREVFIPVAIGAAHLTARAVCWTAGLFGFIAAELWSAVADEFNSNAYRAYERSKAKKRKHQVADTCPCRKRRR